MDTLNTASTTGNALPAKEILVLTLLSEAGGGEPLEGLVAVGHVIRNRALATGRHPVQVVLRNKQFSFWNSFNAGGRDWTRAPKLSEKLGATQAQVNLAGDLADRLLSGREIPGAPMSARMFYNPKKVSPRWGKLLKGVQVIGNHRFGYLPGEYGMPKS